MGDFGSFHKNASPLFGDECRREQISKHDFGRDGGPFGGRLAGVPAIPLLRRVPDDNNEMKFVFIQSWNGSQTPQRLVLDEKNGWIRAPADGLLREAGNARSPAALAGFPEVDCGPDGYAIEAGFHPPRWGILSWK
ncbi:MAG: hypothetical protein ACLFRG_10670 [Desulfococcaceae bacterium]